MKNTALSLLLALLCITGAYAQGDAISRFFKHYEGRDNITDIQISGSLFRMISDAGAKSAEDEFMRMAANIESIRILVDSEDKNGMQTMRDAASKLSGAYETMMTIREKDNHMEMYIAEAAGTVSELVMAIGADTRFVVMSISGKFQLDDLNKLSSTVAKSVQSDAFAGMKVDKADFRVWPNPAKSNDKITIAIPNDMLGAQLTVIDGNGRAVHSEHINQIEKSLNLSKLRSGTYVLKMTKDAIEVNKKLVIQ